MSFTSLLGLPIDIVVDEILLKLPITSLIALKCVNKFFQALISSLKFIQLHARHQSNINRLLLLKSKVYNIDEPLYCLELDSPTTRVMKLPGKEDFFRSSQFVGSCNGLFCFVRDRRRRILLNNDIEQLVFANPCTGIYKFSSFLRLYNTATPNNCRVNNNPTTFGFGYDSINDDYKVVGYNRQSVGGGDRKVGHIVQVMVYSMRTDSWRHIDNVGTCSEDYVLDDNVVVLVNNHLLHWYFWGCRRDKQRLYADRIRCFDLETEKWMADVPLPQIGFFTNLRVINGNLCLTINNNETRHSIWIMKEYGVKESWVKFVVDFPEHTIPYPPNMDFACKTQTGEEKILVKATSDANTRGLYMAYWYLYNLNRQTYDRLEGISPDLKVIATSKLSFVSID